MAKGVDGVDGGTGCDGKGNGLGRWNEEGKYDVKPRGSRGDGARKGLRKWN